jgi:hypothetical protein
VHVDDVMFAAPSESELDGLLKELEKHYIGLTVNRGRVLNYLGMVSGFKTKGVCKVTMDGFVEELLSICHEIKGTASSPAGAELFSLDETSPALSALSVKTSTLSRQSYST